MNTIDNMLFPVRQTTMRSCIQNCPETVSNKRFVEIVAAFHNENIASVEYHVSI